MESIGLESVGFAPGRLEEHRAEVEDCGGKRDGDSRMGQMRLRS